jgi:hypothetical protein
LRVVEVVVADPGERQIGENAVLFAQAVEGDGVAGGVDCASRRQHHAFRAASRSGGVEDDADVIAARCAERVFPGAAKRGVSGETLVTDGLDIRKGVEPGWRIEGQATRLVVDHVGQGRDFRGA